MKITIRADEGKWLTDGKGYYKISDLGDGVSPDEFHEITEEEYQEILKEQEESEVL